MTEPGQLVLQDLERRVQALEKALPDQLFPSLLSLSPTGELEEQLTGKLEAKGVVFEEGSTGTLKPGESTLHEIQWQREGVTLEEVDGYQSITFPVTSHNLRGRVEFSELAAQLLVTVQRNSLTKTNLALVTATAGAQGVTLIDSTGASSFPQLLASERTLIAFGSADLTWAASTDSNAVIVAHGLGVVPRVVLVSYAGAPTGGHLVAVWAAQASFTAEHFEAKAISSTVVSGTVAKGLQWIAIG